MNPWFGCMKCKAEKPHTEFHEDCDQCKSCCGCKMFTIKNLSEDVMTAGEIKIKPGESKDFRFKQGGSK